MKTIVISAVNLNVGGTLTILRDCLSYLSTLAEKEEYRIIAIVYKKGLADFPNIEYIETQWPKERWVNRLWFEYISMRRISKDLEPVYLWFSLHDTSPSVYAERRAVYCHNSFSFYRWKLHDLLFAPKIVLFAIFTKYIYQVNIKRNKYLVVQQEWFRNSMSEMFAFNRKRIIVAPPQSKKMELERQSILKMKEEEFSFVFAGYPNSHKNFEVICQAANILESDLKVNKFKVYITIKGNENKYANWLLKKWGTLKSVQWIGFQSRQSLFNYYEQSDCLIFPSKVETWGLPISEFSSLERPMLLADLPYAHETAAGNKQVAFFDPDRPEVLAEQMKRLIQGDDSFLHAVPKTQLEEPVANSWDELFHILLQS